MPDTINTIFSSSQQTYFPEDNIKALAKEARARQNSPTATYQNLQKPLPQKGYLLDTDDSSPQGPTLQQATYHTNPQLRFTKTPEDIVNEARQAQKKPEPKAEVIDLNIPRVFYRHAA